MPPNADPEMLAGHVLAVVQGMSTLAKDGANRNKLLRIVEGCMSAWPHTLHQGLIRIYLPDFLAEK
ncbi:hypothetical protein GCM10022278_24440 [Allohahella marinimesophila]|uniref:Uncharacterized protein n=1 Tax=Allohahella marinimesophila TaxID=1054972 RepID=A0ABP7PJR8_9GAMM